LACLLVILYHATLLENATGSPSDASYEVGTWLLRQAYTFKLGVALFFVISGYCIAAAADSARHRPRGAREYFVRRFRRIYPPLWAVIVCSIAFFLAVDYWPIGGLLSADPWGQPRPFWYSASQWLGNVTLTETWRHHLFGSPRAHFPGQAWTLCYEEQFYFVCGALAWIVPRLFFHGVAAVTVLTLAVVLVGARTPFPVAGFFFDGSWLLFAAGVAVYYRLSHAHGGRAIAVDLVLLASIPMSWYVKVPIEGASVAFTFAAALPRLYRIDRHIATVRWLRPLLMSGQMCYSLYLVHQLPIKVISALARRYGVVGAWPTLLLTVPVCVIVAVVLGWLFHVAVERRFLNRPLAARAVSLPLVVTNVIQ
jgi:peptidoglycan/LPS O-acetylase OafA/YrhL